jgi:hypothetical protein
MSVVVSACRSRTVGASLGLFALVAGCGSRGEQVGSSQQAVEACDSFATFSVDGNAYNVQNNVWNGNGQPAQCIDAFDTGFVVTEGQFSLTTAGPPASYPSIYKGCHWGNCTPSSGMPAQVGTLGRVLSDWNTSQPYTGAYDVAYDIWFNQTPTTNGQPNAAEIMIWLNHVGGVNPAGTMVASGLALSGATWDVWVARMSSWTYVAYVREGGVTSVSGLDVTQFIDDSVLRGDLSPSDYLLDVEAGFETWQGGTGLTTSSFDVTVTGGQTSSETRTALKTNDGVHFVTAENDGGGVVSTNRTQALGWEIFTIEDLNGGQLTSGDPIHIRHDGANGTRWYGTADVDGGGPGSLFRVNRTTPLEWETFTILKAGGGPIGNGDQVNFQATAHPFFMSAIDAGGQTGDGSVVVDRSQALGWETFTLVFQ